MHQIDTSNNRDNMAFVGETPWHGLGQELTAGADLATWRREAGLEWSVHEAAVQYQNGELRTWPDRKVLYRSDTGAPLSVMAKGFNVVQPADIFALHAEIAKAGGFTMETAGSLNGGKKIWALARVHDGADIVGKDRVRPYLLAATSFDGSLATWAKYTWIRVVCANTLAGAVGSTDQFSRRDGEADDERAGREQVIRIPHSAKWTDELARSIRLKLGIVHSAFERFVVEARALAGAPMSDKEADAFIVMLMQPHAGHKDGKPRDVRESRAYNRILELFKGEARGSEMAQQTRWGMLNAVTELVDHERGIKDSSRLDSAWFGTGAAIKDRAFEILNGEFERVA